MMAENLRYEHLGKLIAVTKNLPGSKVFAEFTGKLRSVQHSSDVGTIVWLTGPETKGEGETEEIILNPTTTVRFL